LYIRKKACAFAEKADGDGSISVVRNGLSEVAGIFVFSLYDIVKMDYLFCLDFVVGRRINEL
jgi:hypothetical protein